MMFLSSLMLKQNYLLGFVPWPFEIVLGKCSERR